MSNMDIRQKAEKLVNDSVSHLAEEFSSNEDIQTLIHELKVHQIELELQNEELHQAQAKILATQNKYFNLYNFAPISYFTFDKEGVIIEVNLKGAELLKQNRQHLLRKPFMLYLQNSSHETFYQHRQAVFNSDKLQTCELTLRFFPATTKMVYIVVESVLVTNMTDNGWQIHSAVIDVTEQKETQAKLKKYYDQLEQLVAERTAALTITNEQLQLEIQQRLLSEQELRQSKNLITAIYDTMHTGICLTDSQGHFVDVNAAYTRIYGYSREELIGQHFTMVVIPEQHEAVIKLYDDFLVGRPEMPAEWRVRRKDGQEIIIDVTANLLVFDEQHCFKVTAVTDITARKKIEEQLKHQAYYDGLTNLPNRISFMLHLDKAIQKSKQQPELMFAVLFLDLNGFKLINDSLGHLAGDELLIAIARRLQKSVRPADVVARLGGDEFTVLVNDISSIAEAEQVADRINVALAQPINLLGQPIFTSASIGIASSRDGYNHAAELLRDADTAMYQAKASGRGQHQRFESAQHIKAVARLQLENELWQALQQEQFILHYQPILELDSSKITVLEVLARWQHPEKGLLLPAEFLSSLEEMNAMLSFTQQITRVAGKQLQQWHREGWPHLRLALNVSPAVLKDGQFADFIKQFLQEIDLDTESILLEVVESSALRHVINKVRGLEQLAELGFKITLDDFGMGYGSLLLLKNLPLNGLKLGRTFVANIGQSLADEAIIIATINLAHELKLMVVADGVDTAVQLAFLQEHGCDKAQGNWVGKSMALTEVRQLLAGEEGNNLWNKM